MDDGMIESIEQAIAQAPRLHALNVRVVETRVAYDIDRDVKKYRVELTFEVHAK